MKKDIKKILLEHSEVKVKLLGEYLDRYLNVISNDGFTKRIKLYDLFCAEGIYENNGEGSPIVALKCIKQLHDLKRATIPVDCLFNDIEKAKTQKLQTIVNEKKLHKNEYGIIEYTNFDYLEIIKKLQNSIPQLKKEKAFIFIDPYGYKHIKASDIKALIKGGKAEVLLFLPTQFMYRFDNNGTPEALKDFIEEITDIKNWKESDNVWQFIDQLKQGFKNYLGAEHFVDNFTIQKDKNTVFCLFFFCSHIKGYEKMLEAKWQLDTEEGKGWQYHGMSDLFAAVQQTNLLEKNLNAFMKKANRTNKEVYEFALRLGYLPSYANDILKNWQKNNNLDVIISATKQKARNNSFYLNYQCYRDSPDKVTFKMK